MPVHRMRSPMPGFPDACRERLRLVGLFLLLLLAAAPATDAFVPLTVASRAGSNAGLVTKWDLAALPDGRIPYWINLNRPPGATPIGPNASPERIIQVIQNAFQTWENVPGTRVRFRYMGLTSVTNGFDGMNVVTFSPQGVQFNPRQPLAAAPWYAPDAGLWSTFAGTTLEARFAGQILDCDIVIDPQHLGIYAVSDDGNLVPERDWDLQGAVVHEVGHFLGLDHTNAGLDCAMNINLSPRGGFTFRNLSADDAIGVSALYPRDGFLASRGIIAGAVRRPDGRGVFGAHVVAVEAESGVIVTSTVSGMSEVYPDGTVKRLSQGWGDYRLVGLLPGTYRVYAEPLDGPDSGNLSGIFWSNDFTRQMMDRDFAPAFFVGAVTVGAQEVAGSVDITVGTRLPMAPNLGVSTFVWTGSVWINPAVAPPGTAPIVSLDPGANLQDSRGFVLGVRFEYHGAGVTLSSALARPGSDILLYLLIAPGAPLGPRLLQATTPDGTSFMSGGFIVVPPPPVIRSVAVAAADEGMTAVIDGENFAATSLPTVLFNGQLGTGLVVDGPTRLRATVPPGVRAPIEIRVITLGGIALR